MPPCNLKRLLTYGFIYSFLMSSCATQREGYFSLALPRSELPLGSTYTSALGFVPPQSPIDPDIVQSFDSRILVESSNASGSLAGSITSTIAASLHLSTGSIQSLTLHGIKIQSVRQSAFTPSRDCFLVTGTYSASSIDITTSDQSAGALTVTLNQKGTSIEPLTPATTSTISPTGSSPSNGTSATTTAPATDASGTAQNGSSPRGVTAALSADQKSSEVSFGQNLIIAVQITHYHDQKIITTVFPIENSSGGSIKDANNQDILWRLQRIDPHGMESNKLKSPDNLNCFNFVVKNDDPLQFSPDPAIITGIPSEALSKIEDLSGYGTNAPQKCKLESYSNINCYPKLFFNNFSIDMRPGDDKNPMFKPVMILKAQAVYIQTTILFDTPSWFDKFFWDGFR